MNILNSSEKMELEKKLIKLRAKLIKNQINLLMISFCTFIFYPIIIFIVYLDNNMGIQFEASLHVKLESFENLTDEFNNMVNEYNSL